MRKSCLLLMLVLLALLAGCEGQYFLRTSDLTGVPGRMAPAVVHLERQEFWIFRLPTKQAAIIVHVEGAPLHAAKTDDAGYAALPVPLPEQPGVYNVTFYHQDAKGDCIAGAGRAYVFKADQPIIAVDFDSLPRTGQDMIDASTALRTLAGYMGIVYVTDDFAGKTEQAHALLTVGNYPDSAVVPYAKARAWWQGGQPRSEPLAGIRSALPMLKTGLAAEGRAAKTLQAAGLTVLGVRDDATRAFAGQYFQRWSDLRAPGQPASAPATRSATTTAPAPEPALAPASVPASTPAGI